LYVTRIGAGDNEEAFKDKARPTTLERELEELKELKPDERDRGEAPEFFGKTTCKHYGALDRLVAARNLRLLSI
jgi:hypothetical protein